MTDDLRQRELFEVLRAALHGAPLARGDVPARSILDAAEQHGLDALVARTIDVDAAERIRAAGREALRLQRTLQRVRSALERRGVEHAFFKGVLSDARWWGGRGLRAATDVDVLVRPEDLQEAIACLRDAGYARARRRGLEVTSAASKERELHEVGRPDEPSVDLHLRPLNDPPYRGTAAEVLSAATSWRTPIGPIRGPSPEHLLVVLAGQLGGGQMSGLPRLALDAACLLLREPIDLAAAADVARRWRVDAALWGLLRLVEGRLGAPVPAWLAAELRPRSATRRRLVESAFVSRPAAGALARAATLLVVDWPLARRPLWPLEKGARWAALRAGDLVVELARARSPARPAAVHSPSSGDTSSTSLDGERWTVPAKLASTIKIPPDVLVQELAGECVLLDMKSERYFGLDEIGTLLFDAMKQHGTVRAAYDAGLAAFDVEPATLEADLIELVDKLVDHGLAELGGA